MGFDFTRLPGGSGLTGELLTGLDLAVSLGQCAGTEGLYLPACIRAVFDLFQLAFELFGAQVLQGRPKLGKDSATDDVALFLIPSTNPVIRLWGFAIRALEAKGIPLSAGGLGHTQYVKLATAVQKDLARQKLKSTIAGFTLFDEYAQLVLKANHPDSNREAIAQRAILDRVYENAVLLKAIDPKTGYPPTIGPPPPPEPTDPAAILDAIRDCVCREMVPQITLLAEALAVIRASLGPTHNLTLTGALEIAANNVGAMERCLCAIEVALITPDPATEAKLKSLDGDVQKMRAKAFALLDYVIDQVPLPPSLRQVLKS